MKNEKRKNKKQYLKAGGIVTSLVIGIVVAILAMHTVTETVVINDIQTQIQESREWKLEPLMDDAAPAAGASGVLNISLVKHGLFEYNSNFTWNTSCFASSTGALTNNSEIGINVPFGIKFDIVALVRWNKTHAFNTTSSNWTWAWVRGNLSMPRYLYENYTLGEWNLTDDWTAAQDFVFGHYVLGGGDHEGDVGGAPGAGNNDGNSINRSERVPQCYFRFWAYY